MTRKQGWLIPAIALSFALSTSTFTIDARTPAGDLGDQAPRRSEVITITEVAPEAPVMRPTERAPETPPVVRRIQEPTLLADAPEMFNATSENNCVEGATYTTDNGQFEITLLSHTSSGGVSTFEWYVCAGPNFRHDLSHWVVDLTGINCYAEGFDMYDLVLGAELNGEPIEYSVGKDPTTGVTGVSFGDVEESCGTFTLYLDETVLTEDIVVGCVLAATKAGNQDVRQLGRRGPNHGPPGFATIAGPVCGERPPKCDSETAFAFGEAATCFSVYGFPRWGWTIGPLAEGSYDYGLYAGAGQCDLEKGVLVGKVEVDYNINDQGVGSVVIKYIVDEPFELVETHAYVGCNPIPTAKNGMETVAPGQYGNDGGVIEDNMTTYLVENVTCDGDKIYVIAHAVVEICD